MPLVNKQTSHRSPPHPRAQESRKQTTSTAYCRHWRLRLARDLVPVRADKIDVVR